MLIKFNTITVTRCFVSGKNVRFLFLSEIMHQANIILFASSSLLTKQYSTVLETLPDQGIAPNTKAYLLLLFFQTVCLINWYLSNFTREFIIRNFKTVFRPF